MQSIVANFSFGTESDLLADEQRCTELRANLGNLLLGIKFSYHFPWLVNGLQSLPEAIAKPIMPPGAVDMLEFQKVRPINAAGPPVLQLTSPTENSSYHPAGPR